MIQINLHARQVLPDVKAARYERGFTVLQFETPDGMVTIFFDTAAEGDLLAAITTALISAEV